MDGQSGAAGTGGVVKLRLICIRASLGYVCTWQARGRQTGRQEEDGGGRASRVVDDALDDAGELTQCRTMRARRGEG